MLTQVRVAHLPEFMKLQDWMVNSIHGNHTFLLFIPSGIEIRICGLADLELYVLR